MLAITEDAAEAIKRIVGSSGFPAGAGLRITRELNTEGEGAPRTDLRLSVVAGPREGDEILEPEPIFLDPSAAQFLDDKLLDADVVDQDVQFRLDVQAETL
jgi:iron-sulfur cluster assembly protein